MNLDTDAIRKLFSGAIVGVRGNRISVLIRAGKADKEWYLDLTQGQLVLLTEFDTLIRPGDRCEGANYPPYERPHTVTGMFCGFSGNYQRPFIIRNNGVLEENYSHIRLAAAEQELAAIRAAIEGDAR